MVVIKKSDLDFENACLAVEREEVCITIMNPDESLSYERKVEEHTKGYTSVFKCVQAVIIKHLKNLYKSRILRHVRLEVMGLEPMTFRV